MVELCLMASHGYPHGLGVGFHPDQVSNRVSKDFNHLLPYQAPNQELLSSHSFNLSLQHFLRKRTALIAFRETHPDLVNLSFGIADQCTRQERILNLLATGSIEEEEYGVVDLSMPYDLMGPHLLYPTPEFYYNEPLLDLAGDMSVSTYNSDSQLQYNFPGIEMNDMLKVMSDFYSSKNTTKSSKQTMLVPFFERRRRARASTVASKLASEKVGSHKSHEKTKNKAPHKKKASTRTITERDDYSKSYLHACESLLSIIADRQHEGKTVILHLKKTGPQLPEFLTQFSATIAGTGIAVVLFVFCRVVSSNVPFSASKLVSTGLGLGLVWLSGAVIKLRNTIINISKSSGKCGEKEEEMLMNNLDGNLRDIYFRVAALMAVAVLRMA